MARAFVVYDFVLGVVCLFCGSVPCTVVFVFVFFYFITFAMSNISNIEELRLQAESLGLSGPDTAKFMLHQQAMEREDRARER